MPKESVFVRKKTGHIFECQSPSQVRTLARTDEARGLLWLMEEEAVQPGGSEETMLERLFSYYGSAQGENKGEPSRWDPIETDRPDPTAHILGEMCSVCCRSRSAAARREASSLPAGPQPRDRLGGVQRSGLANPCQAQPRHPERCHSAAGLPKVGSHTVPPFSVCGRGDL